MIKNTVLSLVTVAMIVVSSSASSDGNPLAINGYKTISIFNNVRINSKYGQSLLVAEDFIANHPDRKIIDTENRVYCIDYQFTKSDLVNKNKNNLAILKLYIKRYADLSVNICKEINYVKTGPMYGKTTVLRAYNSK